MTRKILAGVAAAAVAVFAMLLVMNMTGGTTGTAEAAINQVQVGGPLNPSQQTVVTVDADEGAGDVMITASAGTLTVDGALTPTSCTAAVPPGPNIACAGEVGSGTSTVTIPDLGNNVDTITVTYTAPAGGPANVTIVATQPPGVGARQASVTVRGPATRVEFNIIEGFFTSAAVTSCTTGTAASDPADVIAAANYSFTGDSATSLAFGTLCSIVLDALGNRLPNQQVSYFTSAGGSFTAGGSAGSIDTTRGDGNAATSSLISPGTTGIAGTTTTITAVAISSGVSTTDTVKFGGNPLSCTVTANPTTVPANGGTSALMATLSDVSTFDANRPVPDNTTVFFAQANAGASPANAVLIGSPRATENGVTTAGATVVSTGAAGDIIIVASSGSTPGSAQCQQRVSAEGAPATATATGTGTGTATGTGTPAGQGTITAGTKPPATGGFGLFVFGGGTFAQMETAACGTSTTDAYWVTDATGGFVQFVPQTTVTVVNAGWNAMFPGGTLPAGQPIIGKCA